MSPPKDEGPVAGAPGEALDGSLTQHAARPSAPANATAAPEHKQAPKICVSCRSSFIPTRERFRKCRTCAALIEHAKKRDRDGSTVFRLLTHLHKLRSDDAEAHRWLETLIENRGDDV